MRSNRGKVIISWGISNIMSTKDVITFSLRLLMRKEVDCDNRSVCSDMMDFLSA